MVGLFSGLKEYSTVARESQTLQESVDLTQTLDNVLANLQENRRIPRRSDSGRIGTRTGQRVLIHDSRPLGSVARQGAKSGWLGVELASPQRHLTTGGSDVLPILFRELMLTAMYRRLFVAELSNFERRERGRRSR